MAEAPSDDLGFVPDPQPQAGNSSAPKDDGLGFVPDSAPTKSADEDLGFVRDDPGKADNSALKQYVSHNSQVYNAINQDDPTDSGHGQAKKQNEAKSYYDALKAGLQISTAGLAIRGQLPDTVLPEHSDMGMRILSQIGTLAGDAPAMLLGGAIGAFGGGLTGGVTVPVVGAIPGAVIGAEAGAFALPAALRKVMMDHYEKGDIQTSGEFWDRTMATSWEAIKGGATGMATAIAGPVAGGLTSRLAPALAPIAKVGSELATMTTVGSALEGKAPEAQDFLDAAVVIGGMHGFMSVAPKLRNAHVVTGEHPGTMMEEATTNDVLSQELQSMNPELPSQSHPTDLKYPDLNEVLKEPAEGEKGLSKAEIMEAAQPKIEPKDISLSNADGINNDEVPKAADLNDDEKHFFDKIGKDEEPEARSIKDILKDKASDLTDDLHELYARTLDRGAAVRRLLDKAGVEPSQKDSVALIQMMGASGDVTKGFIENNTRDFNTGEVNGEGFKTIVDDYRKEFPDDAGMQKLTAYRMAARTLELAGRGIDVKVNGETLSPEVAKKVVDAGKSQFEPYMKRMVEFGNRSLEYMHDSGYFTPEVFKSMIDLNKSHFAFNRIMDEDEFTGKTKGSRGVKRIQGEGGFFQDPILSTVKNTDMMLRLAEENRVKQQFIKDIGKSEDPDSFVKVVKTKMMPVELSPKDIAKALKDVGVDTTDANISEGAKVFKPSLQPLRENEFAVYNDGKREVYETHPVVAEAIKSLAGNPPAAIVFSGLLKAAPAIIRAGVLTNPFFALRHMYRNEREAPVYSQTGLGPEQVMKNLPEFLAGGDLYKQALHEGAFVSNILPIDKDYIDGTIHSLDQKVPFLDKVRNYMNPLNALSALESGIHHTIGAHDNLVRYTEFKNAIDQGKAPDEAAYLARNVLPDYQKQGIQKSALLQLAAFSKIHLLAESRMIEGLKNDPQGTLLRSMLYIGVPSLMLYVANQNDDRVNDLPEWEKNSYDHVAIDHWRPPNNESEAQTMKENDPRLVREAPDGTTLVNDGPILRMPLPFTLGTIFGRGPTMALDAFREHDPSAFEAWAKHVAFGMTTNLIPDIARAPLEQMTNYSFFTGRPIVSSAAEKNLPELESTQYTSEVAKQLGRMIHFIPGVKDIGTGDATLENPLVIDNYIRSTGTMFQYGTALIDKGLHAAGIGDTANATVPEKHFTESPFIKEFFITNPNTKIQALVDFDDEYKKATKLRNAINSAKNNGDLNTLNYINERYPEGPADLEGFKQTMDEGRGFIKNVMKDETMTPTDKRQLIDNAMYSIMATAKMGHKAFKDIEKLNKEALKNNNGGAVEAQGGQ